MHHVNSSPQRQLVRTLLKQVESRNFIITGLVTVALQEIRRYQKSTGLSTRELPFQGSVGEIA